MSTLPVKPTRKRRTCSYDMMEVHAGCYELEDGSGPMYFCNGRCLGLWAATFATHPNRKETEDPVSLDLTTPGGECRRFDHVQLLAQWAVANLLDGNDNPWFKNGSIVSEKSS